MRTFWPTTHHAFLSFSYSFLSCFHRFLLISAFFFTTSVPIIDLFFLFFSFLFSLNCPSPDLSSLDCQTNVHLSLSFSLCLYFALRLSLSNHFPLFFPYPTFLFSLFSSLFFFSSFSLQCSSSNKHPFHGQANIYHKN